MRFAVLFALVACGQSPPALTEEASERLESVASDPGALGERVYVGDTLGPDGSVVYTYERRVRTQGPLSTSTHVTTDQDGAAVLLHSSVHDERYRLVTFEEIHAQTGWQGTVTVDPELEEVVFAARHGDRSFEKVETLSDPVLTGPTLFGFALEHWDGLGSGESISLRFVQLDQLRTYGFTIALAAADAQETVFELRATSPFVRAAIPAMYVTFDTATRTPIRYEGRVPPLLDGGKLEALVEYREVVTPFR